MNNAHFFCLCMSPSLDATVTLPRAPAGEGEIFKDVPEQVTAGGKGVNVARWLALRGASVTCGGLLGRDNDEPFVRELKRCGIKDRFVRVPGATRTNEMLVWPGGSTKINRQAFPGLDPSKAREVLDGPDGLDGLDVLDGLDGPDGLDGLDGPDGLDGRKEQDDMGKRNGGMVRVAILSGSLPPAVPPDFYAQAIRRFKASGWKTVLDASGEAMRLGVEAGPDLIKPNADECKDLVGFLPDTPDAFHRATEALRRRAKSVIISDAARGAWFDGSFVTAPSVGVVDSTAAGDTLLAEYCWRTWENHSDPARWAVAAGSAACTMPGGTPPSPDLVARLTAQIPARGLATEPAFW